MTDSLDIRNSSFGSRIVRHSKFALRNSYLLAPHGMAGRSKVRVKTSELRNSGGSHSTFEIQHSSFAPSSHQSGRNSTSTFEIHPSNFLTALPGQLFYSTPIPVCLWFLVKSKAARLIKSLDNSTPVNFRERRRETLKSWQKRLYYRSPRSASARNEYLRGAEARFSPVFVSRNEEVAGRRTGHPRLYAGRRDSPLRRPKQSS